MSAPWLPPLALFSVLWLAQVATPGPNFVRISHTALTLSRRAAMTTASGTAVGNALWCFAAAMGAAILMQQPLLGRGLRIMGALYFGWYGLRLLWLARKGAAGIAPPVFIAASGLTAFRNGFATAIANPQAILFFATVLVTMFPRLDAALIATMLGLVVAITLGWYALVSTFLVAPSTRRIYQRLRPVIDVAFGAMLLLAAVRLI